MEKVQYMLRICFFIHWELAKLVTNTNAGQWLEPVSFILTFPMKRNAGPSSFPFYLFLAMKYFRLTEGGAIVTSSVNMTLTYKVSTFKRQFSH